MVNYNLTTLRQAGKLRILAATAKASFICLWLIARGNQEGKLRSAARYGKIAESKNFLLKISFK